MKNTGRQGSRSDRVMATGRAEVHGRFAGCCATALLIRAIRRFDMAVYLFVSWCLGAAPTTGRGLSSDCGLRAGMSLCIADRASGRSPSGASGITLSDHISDGDWRD